MKCLQWLAVGAMVFLMGIWACEATAGDAKTEPTKKAKDESAAKPAKDAKKDKAPGDEAAEKIVLPDAFGDLAKTLQLPLEQQKKLKKLADDRDMALANFDKSNEAKRTALANDQMSEDTRRREGATASLKKIDQDRAKLGSEFLNRAFAQVLTPQQRGEYNGGKLKASVLKEFAPAGLTPEQTEKIDMLCKNRGAQVPGALDDATTKKMVSELNRMVQGGLTPDQRKSYADAKNKKKK